MISWLRRPRADLSVHVDKTELRPGEGLEARVALLPESDFLVRRGTIELVCTETYVERTGTTHGTSTYKLTETLYSAGETFLSDVTVRNGVPHTTDVMLAVPTDGIPTVSGTKIGSNEPGIAWEVMAFIDVAGARDLRRSQPIVVLSSPASEERVARPVVTQVKHEQCALALTVSSGDARSGDRLVGELRADMLRDVSAEEIRVELVRSELFGNVPKDATVDEVTLERDISLRSGQLREWKYQLDVGEVAMPSLRARKSYVRWLVKAWLTRNMRRDLRIEQEIRVDI